MATVYEGDGASRDAVANTNTTYTMSVGDTFHGILDHKFDEDWIKIELEKGKTYRINLSGRGKDGDEAEDTILKLYDSQGNLVAMNDDIDTAKRIYDSELTVTITFTDTYYLSAGSYTSNPNLDNSGAYALTVNEAVGDAAVGIRGTDSGDSLVGTNSAEKIYGLAGNDTLSGRGGNDELDGGSGNDTLNGGAGADKLVGGDGSDTASWAGSNAGVTARLHSPDPRGGHAQGDTFGGTTTFSYRDKGNKVTVTLPDIENLTGSSHNDVLAGDQRANRISGGAGDDILYGGPGGDTTNKDTMYGDAGNDKVYGGRGDDSLYGGSGNDRLYGGPDDDNLYGGSGSDRLAGGDDDDVLDGGTGDDILEGGPGADIFRFSRGDGDDDIADFNTSRRDGDRIDLSDFREIDSMDDLSIKQRGSHTRIDLDEYDGGEIWLLDIDKEDLDDDDFIFYGDDRTSGRDDDDDDDDDRGGGGGGGRTDPPPLTGPAGDDILYGSSGANSLNGGKGDDVLYGGSGDDTLKGGPGVDSYEGGPGSDTLIVDVADFFDEQNVARTEKGAIDGGENPGGRENSDTLSFADWVNSSELGVTVTLADDKVFYGGVESTGVYKNIEHIIGSPYADTLTGDGGANVIDGGAGRDKLDGGTGNNDNNDTLSYQSHSASEGVTVNLATPSSSADESIANFENIIGSPQDDTLTGDGNANVIEGGAGKDKLNGGSGTDTLSYQGSNAGVTVDLRAGTGGLIQKSEGGHAEGDDVTSGTFENITGSRYRDTLTGDSNTNVLEGGPGRDTLDGGGGDNDTASYAGATAAVTVDLTESGRGRGDAAGDSFILIDQFLGSAHDDTFIASTDADIIDGGDGLDTVSYAQSGAKVAVDLTADTQNDTTAGSYANGDKLTSIENIIGSPKDDTLTGDGKANVIKGGAGDDILDGAGEADTLEGGDGMDTLKGGAGADTLEGGDDRDTLTGGADNDTFIFAYGDGNDTITDFGTGDNKIDLSAFTTIASLEDLVELQDDDDISANSDGHTVFELPGGGVVELRSFSTTLTDDDFIFYSRPTSVSDRNDVLTGDYKANTLRGGKGNDKLYGRAGNDILYGGDGDDRLEGEAGVDTLHGGKGSDTFIMTFQTGTQDTVYGEGDLDENGTIDADETGDNVDPTSVDTISYEKWSDPDQNRVTFTADSTNGIENIIGSPYADTLTGDGGANVIDGGAGRDKLDGGTGNNDNNDTLSYQSHSASEGVTVNLATPSSSADESIANFENIIGSPQDDTLTGDGNANVIEGGAGKDKLNGGSGTDTLSYQGSNAGVTVDLRAGTGGLIQKSEGGHAEGDDVTSGTFENITGSRYRDTLTGDSNTNVLEGGPGRDTLDGGGGDNDTASYAGATAAVTVDLTESGRGRGDAAGDSFILIDQFLGSAHDDTFIASTDADIIDGGDGLDTVSYAQSGAKVAVDLTADTQNDTTAGSYANGDKLTSIENIIGSPKDDTLTGDGKANVIKGGAGDDILDGAGEADTLEGGDGMDTLKGGAGADTLEGGDDRDTLTGGADNDTFIFAYGDGNDTITDFGTGDNKIDLSAFTTIASLEDLVELQDDDDISANSDGHTVFELPGGGVVELRSFSTTLTDDDFIFYTSVINGNSGNNTLRGDRRGNEINAGAGNDQVFGNGGRDTLNGEAGDDTMYGGADNDTLNGGPGNDLLDGGPGADKFVFEPGNGDDYIMDFTSLTDKIDLSAFELIDEPDDSTTGDDNYVINLPDGGTITILGVTTLNDNDFMLS